MYKSKIGSSIISNLISIIPRGCTDCGNECSDGCGELCSSCSYGCGNSCQKDCAASCSNGPGLRALPEQNL